MSSILTSIQIYSEGFCLASKTKIYECCLAHKTKSVNIVLYVRQYLHMIR